MNEWELTVGIGRLLGWGLGWNPKVGSRIGNSSKEEKTFWAGCSGEGVSLGCGRAG